MQEVLQQIAIHQGWQLQQASPVYGGDINQAFALDTNKGRFFIKLNDAGQYPEMFLAEADGLTALQKDFPLKVPSVVAVGEVENTQYLLLEWLENTNHTNQSWEAFGQALAQLHRTTNKQFGWHQNNYLGSIKVNNDWCNDWSEFYSNNRLLPFVKMLRDQNVFSAKEVQQAEAFCAALCSRLPTEPPALLHGDLWSGNASAVKVDNQITIAIYDPAVCYGHREIDIALTRLFGGFPSIFYDAYHEAYPLQSGWQQRLPLFQLSHLLLHAVLFGGGYIGRCKEIMK